MIRITASASTFREGSEILKMFLRRLLRSRFPPSLIFLEQVADELGERDVAALCPHQPNGRGETLCFASKL